MQTFSNIKSLIEDKKFSQIKSILMEMEPYDIAEALRPVEDKDALIIFRLLPKELAAETFVEFDTERRHDWIKSLSDKELGNILAELFVDDTVDIVEEMPANIVKRILTNCDADTRKEINEILRYPPNSAGSIMTTEYVSLRPAMSVAEAFVRIKEVGKDKETLEIFFVTDNQRKLLGCLTVRNLILASMDAVVGDIMDKSVVTVSTTEDREFVAKKMANYNFTVIPIVDKENRLVGIVTADDVIDVITQEATEDIHLMAAVAPNDEPYLMTSVWVHWRKRIVWLLVLMVSGVLTGLIINKYEAMFATLPLLVAFLPRLMGTGGNCGAQSSTLIIRGLALDELHPRDVFKIMAKELTVALLVGIALALANTPILWILYGFEYGNTVWWLCLSYGITIVVVVVIAKLLGCTLPLLAKKCHLDPALMASPIITTLVDVLSVLTFFVIANAIVFPHLV
ncbi:MAG: magnesium transporter [Clostridia bacterium]|nr:magnesium transporter [Clostridia bacterium]